MSNKKEVLFPPVVMAHITDDLSKVYKNKLDRKDSAVIHFSSQPNGIPHLGTITTLGTAFALGKLLEDKIGISTKVKVATLENAPIEKVLGENGIEYARLICNIPSEIPNLTLSQYYMQFYHEILNKFKDHSGIDYEVYSYNEFQSNSYVRSRLIEMIKREEKFGPILSPNEGILKFRFNCPDCGYQDKSSQTVKLIRNNSDSELVFSSSCLNHEDYELMVTPENNTFIDMNTTLRSVIRKSQYIKEAKENNALNLMVDGGDWSHLVPLLSDALIMLGHSYFDLPQRVSAPIIEDWSGAKFSKFLYVEKESYDEVPEGLINYEHFISNYGDNGFSKLWKEIESWPQNPKKLFRNYSIEYFANLLEK